MAIKGLGKQRGSRARAIPTIGKLRKGAPKGARQPGKDLDYFRFTSERPEVVAAFGEAFGEEPREVKAYLTAKSAVENFDPWKEQWDGGGRLLHRCDGEYCVLWRGEDGKMVEDPERALQRPCPGKCKETGRLSLIIPELWKAGYVGYVTLETHSKYDIVHMNTVLSEIEEQAAEHDLRGIEFVIWREAVVVSAPKPNSSDRIRVSKSLVRITPAAAWVKAQLGRARARALGEPVKPAYRVMDSETGEVVEGVTAPSLPENWDEEEEEIPFETDGEGSPEEGSPRGTSKRALIAAQAAEVAQAAAVAAPPLPGEEAIDDLETGEPEYDGWVNDKARRVTFMGECRAAIDPHMADGDKVSDHMLKALGVKKWSEIDEQKLHYEACLDLIKEYAKSLAKAEPSK